MRNKHVTSLLQDEVERIPECIAINKFSRNFLKTELVCLLIWRDDIKYLRSLKKFVLDTSNIWV